MVSSFHEINIEKLCNESKSIIKPERFQTKRTVLIFGLKWSDTNEFLTSSALKKQYCLKILLYLNVAFNRNMGWFEFLRLIF